MRLKPVSKQVVVITGASSGIGLVTARQAAERGARVVLAARNEEALDILSREIRDSGGEAVAAPADVGSEDDVEAIAQTAIETFGEIDTWVNNAGVGMYGQMLDMPIADCRRLFETNFWGVVYGSLVAARRMRDRADRRAGAIINVGSEVSDRAVIELGMYSASKHAVKGFTDALRMELEHSGAPISVTLVKPGATNTPFPHHARNFMDREPMLPSPVYAPEVVADAILFCAEQPRREIAVGMAARMHRFEGQTLPRLTDILMERTMPERQRANEPARHREEALWGPSTGLQERGDSPHHVRESSFTTQAALRPWLTGALVVGAGLALSALAGAANASADHRHAQHES